jgi:glycosidase
MPNRIRLSIACVAFSLVACARLKSGGAPKDGGTAMPIDSGATSDAPDPASEEAGDDASGDAPQDASSLSEEPLPEGGDAGGLAPLPVAADTWLSQVIYLVIVDRFANGDPSNDSAVRGCFDPANPSAIHGGDFAGLDAQIPYLQDLGVTAVWMTPVMRQSADRCSYHGYWGDFVDPDDGAIAANLGTPDDLARLVTDLHAANIRVILDNVVNHSGVQARIVTQHPDWFHDPSTCGALGSTTIYCPIGGVPLPDFAQEKPAVAAYLSSLSAHLVSRFGADAVRADSVKNVFPLYWKSSWLPAMRTTAPSLFTIGEVFDESAASALLPFLEDGFDSLFDYPRYAQIVATFAQGGTVDGLASAVADANTTYGPSRALQMTAFVDNHDQPRLTSLVPAGTADADNVARFRLALGATFTLPGIPQLMWGDELGLVGGSDPDNRRDMPSWAWSAMSRGGTHAESVGDGQAQYAYVQKLIATRALHTALQKGSYAELWRQNGGAANLFVFFRGDANDRVVVAINPGAASTVSNMPIANSHNLAAADKAALHDGTVLTEVLGAGAPPSVTVAAGVLALTMPAQTIGLYVAP